MLDDRVVRENVDADCVLVRTIPEKKDLSLPQRPPRMAFARSMLQMRLIASTREMSSRAYSCIVKMKLGLRSADSELD